MSMWVMAAVIALFGLSAFLLAEESPIGGGEARAGDHPGPRHPQPKGQ